MLELIQSIKNTFSTLSLQSFGNREGSLKQALAVIVANGLAYSCILRPAILKYGKESHSSIDSGRNFKRTIAILGTVTLGSNLILSKMFRISASGTISVIVTLATIGLHLLLKSGVKCRARPTTPSLPPSTPPLSSLNLSSPIEDPDHTFLKGLGFSDEQLSEFFLNTVGQDSQSAGTMIFKTFCERMPDAVDTSEKRAAILQQIQYDFGSLCTLPQYEATTHEWEGIPVEVEYMSNLLAAVLNYYEYVLYAPNQPTHLTVRQMIGLTHETGATQSQLRAVFNEWHGARLNAGDNIPTTFTDVNIVKKFQTRKGTNELDVQASLELLKKILSSIANSQRHTNLKYTENNESLVIFCENIQIDYYEGLEILGRCFQEAHERGIPLPKTPQEKKEFLGKVSPQYHSKGSEEKRTKAQRYTLLKTLIEEVLLSPLQSSEGTSSPSTSRARHWRGGKEEYGRYHRQQQQLASMKPL